MLLYIICFISAFSFQSGSQPQKPTTPSENLFYMVDSEASYQSFKKHIDQISIAAPQVYSFTTSGVVYGQIDPRITQLAQENHVKVMPLITNGSFNWELLHTFLHNDNAKARAIKTLVKLAGEHDFYGWQFDIENVHIQDRKAFTEFYQATSKALHKSGFALSAAVVPTDSDFEFHTGYHRFLYQNWRGGYNYQALAQAGDFLSLMTYSQHTRRTPPGPVAGIPWMKQMVEYLTDIGVDPQKISLGIPFYSTHWFADYSKQKGGFMNGKSMSYGEAKGIATRNHVKVRWMKDSKCHYAYWSNDGTFEYIFFEDAKSLKPKLALLKRFNLRGISVWLTGQGDPDAWKVIEAKLKPTLQAN